MTNQRSQPCSVTLIFALIKLFYVTLIVSLHTFSV